MEQPDHQVQEAPNDHSERTWVPNMTPRHHSDGSIPGEFDSERRQAVQEPFPKAGFAERLEVYVASVVAHTCSGDSPFSGRLPATVSDGRNAPSANAQRLVDGRWRRGRTPSTDKAVGKLT